MESGECREKALGQGNEMEPTQWRCEARPWCWMAGALICSSSLFPVYLEKDFRLVILRKYQQACLQLSEDNETPLLRHCSSGYTSFLPVVIDFSQKWKKNAAITFVSDISLWK